MPEALTLKSLEKVATKVNKKFVGVSVTSLALLEIDESAESLATDVYDIE